VHTDDILKNFIIIRAVLFELASQTAASKLSKIRRYGAEKCIEVKVSKSKDKMLLCLSTTPTRHMRMAAGSRFLDLDTRCYVSNQTRAPTASLTVRALCIHME
jgi:hypothetical protein